MFKRISIAAMLCVALSATTLVMAQKISRDLEDAISEASIWVGWKPDDSLYPKQDGKKALEDGKTCIDKIDEALSKWLAASTAPRRHLADCHSIWRCKQWSGHRARTSHSRSCRG